LAIQGLPELAAQEPALVISGSVLEELIETVHRVVLTADVDEAPSKGLQDRKLVGMVSGAYFESQRFGKWYLTLLDLEQQAFQGDGICVSAQPLASDQRLARLAVIPGAPGRPREEKMGRDAVRPDFQAPQQMHLGLSKSAPVDGLLGG